MICSLCGEDMKESWHSYEREDYCDCELTIKIRQKQEEIRENQVCLRKLQEELRHLQETGKYAMEIKEVKRKYEIHQ